MDKVAVVRGRNKHPRFTIHCGVSRIFKDGAGKVKYNWLKPGVKVRLWPGDTYAKYAVVREVDFFTVTFEITRVESGENYYAPGQRITLPWSHVKVVEE